jgi:hypothetical protein
MSAPAPGSTLMNLIDELTLFQTGGHVMRRPEEVLRAVDDLRRAGYGLLLAAYGVDDDFAKALSK